MRYKKKPEIVEAVQWFKPGDHKYVCAFVKEVLALHMNTFNRPDIELVVDKNGECNYGTIKTLTSNELVHPGDWIIHDLKTGEYYPMRPDMFKKMYDKTVHTIEDYGLKAREGNQF